MEWALSSLSASNGICLGGTDFWRACGSDPVVEAVRTGPVLARTPFDMPRWRLTIVILSPMTMTASTLVIFADQYGRLLATDIVTHCNTVARRTEVFDDLHVVSKPLSGPSSAQPRTVTRDISGGTDFARLWIGTGG